MTSKSFYDRHGLWIALLGLVLLPFVVYAGLRSLGSNSNQVADWLPSDYPETAEYHWFRQHFANDEYVLATWEGCTLDDFRLDEFAERVVAPGAYTDRSGNDRFPRVVTGRSALDEMLTSHANLEREDAIEKLKGALVGPDGRQTFAIVSLTDNSRLDAQATLAQLRQAAINVGIPAADVRLGGPAVLNAAIDTVSSHSLNRVVVLSVIVVTLIGWWTIRDVRLMLLILITGLYAAAISLAVLWLSGESMNAILVTMIPMVYVVATSGAIHLCNYYLESVREGGVAGAAGRAVAHAWVPLGLATLTTAAGLLSVCYTDLTLIRMFGLYSAIGVALCWVLLVVWLPAMLTAWRPRTSVTPESVAEEEETGEAPLPPFWTNLGERVTARPTLLMAACLLAFAACLPGLSRLRVTIDLMEEFLPGSDIIRTYTWLEDKLGPLMPMEVVVRIDESSPLTLHQRVRLVERLQRRFEDFPDTGGSISAATYVPDVPAPGPAWLRQGILNKRLERDRERLFQSGYLTRCDGQELWRITVRVVALREVDYGQLVSDLRREFDDEIASTPQAGEGITATYTGVAPVLFKARRSLVDGLYWGVITDLILIVVSITLLMRHWSSGVVMALTSLFPTVIVLGTIGWLGIKVDLGAIMAPCVALGVTVDDVIHFLLWFRTGAQRGMSRRESVLLAWRACVRPMYQSWSLLGLGMGCLAISDFVPILQFGAIMIAMLTVGLIGNLVFLPSVLAGPLGGVIARQARVRSPQPAVEPRVKSHSAV